MAQGGEGQSEHSLSPIVVILMSYEVFHGDQR